MESLSGHSNHVMYIVAREQYLTALLKENAITQAQFDQMDHFLYERFKIAELELDGPGSLPTVTVAAATGKSTAKERELPLIKAETAPPPPEEMTFVSLTELVQKCSEEAPSHVIQSWMRHHGTLELLRLWEVEHNPAFRQEGCKELLNQQKTSAFTMTPKKWIEQTNAKGLVSKAGKNGGTYAHPALACEFMMWLSPAYRLAMIEMNRQTLKVGDFFE